MKFFFALVLTSLSMSAIAGYHCDLKLAHTEDVYKTIATKSISIETGGLRSGSEGTLLIESKAKKKVVSLEIRSVVDGGQGDEEAALVILRRESKKKSFEQYRISENLHNSGNQASTFWFDNYKLDVACKIQE